MGTYSICPTCAPGIIRDADRTGEPFVHCPGTDTLQDWVLQLRGGRTPSKSLSSERDSSGTAEDLSSPLFSCSAFHLGLCRSATACP